MADFNATNSFQGSDAATIDISCHDVFGLTDEQAVAPYISEVVTAAEAIGDFDRVFYDAFTFTQPGSADRNIEADDAFSARDDFVLDRATADSFALTDVAVHGFVLDETVTASDSVTPAVTPSDAVTASEECTLVISFLLADSPAAFEQAAPDVTLDCEDTASVGEAAEQSLVGIAADSAGATDNIVGRGAFAADLATLADAATGPVVSVGASDEAVTSTVGDSGFSVAAADSASASDTAIQVISFSADDSFAASAIVAERGIFLAELFAAGDSSPSSPNTASTTDIFVALAAADVAAAFGTSDAAVTSDAADLTLSFSITDSVTTGIEVVGAGNWADDLATSAAAGEATADLSAADIGITLVEADAAVILDAATDSANASDSAAVQVSFTLHDDSSCDDAIQAASFYAADSAAAAETSSSDAEVAGADIIVVSEVPLVDAAFGCDDAAGAAESANPGQIASAVEAAGFADSATLETRLIEVADSAVATQSAADPLVGVDAADIFVALALAGVVASVGASDDVAAADEFDVVFDFAVADTAGAVDEVVGVSNWADEFSFSSSSGLVASTQSADDTFSSSITADTTATLAPAFDAAVATEAAVLAISWDVQDSFAAADGITDMALAAQDAAGLAETSSCDVAISASDSATLTEATAAVAVFTASDDAGMVEAASSATQFSSDEIVAAGEEVVSRGFAIPDGAAFGELCGLEIQTEDTFAALDVAAAPAPASEYAAATEQAAVLIVALDAATAATASAGIQCDIATGDAFFGTVQATPGTVAVSEDAASASDTAQGAVTIALTDAVSSDFTFELVQTRDEISFEAARFSEAVTITTVFAATEYVTASDDSLGGPVGALFLSNMYPTIPVGRFP